jgi:hypothetical protein
MDTNKQTFHKFLSSQIDIERCAICRIFKPNHVCEICGLNVDSKGLELELTMDGRILMCHSCYESEHTLINNDSNIESTNNQSYTLTNKELGMFKWTCKCGIVNNGMNEKCTGKECNEVRPDELTEISTIASLALSSSRAIDQSITVRTDLFNAETVAIVDLKKIIDENVEITNKPFALASELKKRFEHFQSVIFAKQEEIVETANKQKAIQVYLNELANKLRSEEREKLKIADINYKPVSKEVKVPKITVKKVKLDKELLTSTAKELGIPVFTLQSFVTAKNCTIEVAANMIKASLGK